MFRILNTRTVLSGLKLAKHSFAIHTTNGQMMETSGKKFLESKTKAVIFDMGGVLLPSPGRFFLDFEANLGLSRGTLIKVIISGGSDGAWQRLERGEINVTEFGRKFTEECSHHTGKSVDLTGMMSSLSQYFNTVHPYLNMINAIRCLRAEGIKTAVLTNNFQIPDHSTYMPLDQSLFDVIVESTLVKMRKPEHRIYKYTLEKLQVEPQEAVFLDDIGENVKAARELGLRTIKVTGPEQAIEDLEKQVGFPLQGYIPGTSVVPKRLEIPVDRLENYLNSVLNLHDTKRPILRCFDHGQSNPTYSVQYAGKNMVLRKKPPGKLLPSAHAIEREYRVMKSLQNSRVPVPNMLGLCVDDSILGTPFYVMEYVNGRIFKDPLLPGLSPAQRQEIYVAACDTLVKIHKVNIKEVGLDDYGKQGEFVKRNFMRWSKQFQASKTREIEAMDKLMNWLSERMPENEMVSLVHGDFRIDNLIFHPHTSEVLAVIDWELSTLGDPFTDLANLCMMYYLEADTGILPSLRGADVKSLGILTTDELVHAYSPKLGISVTDEWEFYLAYILFRGASMLEGVNLRHALAFRGADLNALGIPTLDQFLQRYFQQTGIPGIDNWDFYIAFNFFRGCAILEGVYKRFLIGQASSPNAQLAGLAAEYFAQTGWDIASKSRISKSSASLGSHSKVTTSETSGSTSGGKRDYSTKASDVELMQRMQSSQSYSTASDRVIPGSLPLSVSALSPRAQDYYKRVKAFIAENVIPFEEEFHKWTTDPKTKWTVHPKVEQLKEKAKSEGLWNLFIPKESDPDNKYGAGLSNIEYAYIAEEMGKTVLGSEPFNCSAPDTGNMEVLIRYGTEEQKEKWLRPLLEGKIRSCFAMTEPAVASSDATNIQASIRKDGDHYVINGRKWWTSGATDPRCKVCIFMGKTDTSRAIHQQQSMVIVPMDAPGVQVVRALSVFGFDDAPHGHAEVLFENVRVPVSNLLYGEGRGFEIAQGRLGPGRIHHCMRTIGAAERALQLMVARAQSRIAFGKPLSQQSSIEQDIAKSRIEIEQSRLLVLKAAYMMDTVGNKVAASEIAMIKALVPNVACKIVDRAIQVHGGMGLCQDTVLPAIYAWSRVLRIADGPDEVHYRSIAKMELRTQNLSKL